ncbi:MAG: class II glutamine amidotransferase [Planctomycetes bacterium]|nr:class II glutamine amidotransferase [Planctomycetota bacterium]MCP4838805.1 class II glutamine amidotransferase [Planctomycetota bacterium]
MCRWIAYTGPELRLAELLVKPSHSLLAQSRHAEQSTFAVNADGYGVGWYTGFNDTPGVYHETRPAWNDENLKSIASHLTSPLFMAHIRAATSAVSRTNCHPFRAGRWLFQHNGAIGDFDRIRHDLDGAIDPTVYATMKGCTDSETMFGLCQSEGLADDPAEAIARMINRVEASRRQKGIKAAFNMTVALSDGEELWAARYGSDGDGPSLYHSASQAALDTASAADGVIESKATIVVSEPLDGCEEHWTAIPARHVLRASGNDVEIWPLP